MNPFSLLVKPVSADCNLCCDYCFYRGHAALYPAPTAHRMADAVLEKLIAGYLATEQPQYVFGWQGGEPTILGAGFFRRVIELQQKYGRAGATLANGLQTNATLIDDEMAAHFARYNFLVGVSLDGPQPMHDRFRRRTDGAGSFRDVLRGVDCLRRHGAEFNILVLVSAANVRRPREVYRFLRDQNFAYHQYIPCVEFDAGGAPRPWTVSGGEWGDFLCGIFDEWAAADTRRVSVRNFDSVLLRLAGGRSGVCHMEHDCRQYFVVEYNGDIYPCDFFVERELKLGNLSDTTWQQAQAHPLYRQFGERKSQWRRACHTCGWKKLCAGDCPKHRPRGGLCREPSWLCAGWKQFYAHARPGFEKLAVQIGRRTPAGY